MSQPKKMKNPITVILAVLLLIVFAGTCFLTYTFIEMCQRQGELAVLHEQTVEDLASTRAHLADMTAVQQETADSLAAAEAQLMDMTTLQQQTADSLALTESRLTDMTASQQHTAASLASTESQLVDMIALQQQTEESLALAESELNSMTTLQQQTEESLVSTEGKLADMTAQQQKTVTTLTSTQTTIGEVTVLQQQTADELVLAENALKEAIAQYQKTTDNLAATETALSYMTSLQQQTAESLDAVQTQLTDTTALQQKNNADFKRAENDLSIMATLQQQAAENLATAGTELEALTRTQQKTAADLAQAETTLAELIARQQNATDILIAFEALPQVGIDEKIPASFELKIGEKAKGWGSVINTSKLNLAEYLWSSSDESVVTVTPEGILHAQGAGQATVTITHGYNRQIIGVTVLQPAKEAATIHLNETVLITTPGRLVNAVPVISPDNILRTDLIWMSEDESIAKVTNYGISGVSVGETRVTAILPGYLDQQGNIPTIFVQVIVKPAAESITCTHDAFVYVGDPVKPQVSVFPAGAESSVRFGTFSTLVPNKDNEFCSTVPGLEVFTVTAIMTNGVHTSSSYVALDREKTCKSPFSPAKKQIILDSIKERTSRAGVVADIINTYDSVTGYQSHMLDAGVVYVLQSKKDLWICVPVQSAGMYEHWNVFGCFTWNGEQHLTVFELQYKNSQQIAEYLKDFPYEEAKIFYCIDAVEVFPQIKKRANDAAETAQRDLKELLPESFDLRYGEWKAAWQPRHDNDQIDFSAYTWVSSDQAVVSVSPDGTLHAHAAGHAEITVTCDGISRTIPATVAAPVRNGTSLSFKNRQMMVTVGKTILNLPNSSPTYTKSTELLWTSSDETVAKVYSSGTVKGISAGDATITAWLPGYSNNDQKIPTASFTVHVSVAPMGISCENERVVYTGETVKFKISILPQGADPTAKITTESGQKVTNNIYTFGKAGWMNFDIVSIGNNSVKTTAGAIALEKSQTFHSAMSAQNYEEMLKAIGNPSTRADGVAKLLHAYARQSKQKVEIVGDREVFIMQHENDLWVCIPKRLAGKITKWSVYGAIYLKGEYLLTKIDNFSQKQAAMKEEFLALPYPKDKKIYTLEDAAVLIPLMGGVK